MRIINWKKTVLQNNKINIKKQRDNVIEILSDFMLSEGNSMPLQSVVVALPGFYTSYCVGTLVSTSLYSIA